LAHFFEASQPDPKPTRRQQTEVTTMAETKVAPAYNVSASCWTGRSENGAKIVKKNVYMAMKLTLCCKTLYIFLVVPKLEVNQGSFCSSLLG